MKKKTRKHQVEEPQAVYGFEKPAAAASGAKPIRYADPAKARKVARKVLDDHKELFRRLAQ